MLGLLKIDEIPAVVVQYNFTDDRMIFLFHLSPSISAFTFSISAQSPFFPLEVISVVVSKIIQRYLSVASKKLSSILYVSRQ